MNGRRCYVLRITPKAQGKYLIRGRIWVDAEDFAVVRVEGEPAEGHFWIRSTHLVQRYRKVEKYWLPAVNESDSDVRIFGRAHLTIENLEYQINHYDAENRAEAVSRRPRVE